jgi:hypothetical protein
LFNNAGRGWRPPAGPCPTPSRLWPAITFIDALPRGVAFWLVAWVLFLLFFAAAAPSPLYGIYQAQWRFSAITLTAVFAAYALLLLVTLPGCHALSASGALVCWCWRAGAGDHVA